MKHKTLKLLLSSTAASLAALSLSASTFAYVLISNNVYVSDFNFEIESQEGLNISLDGVNWSQDITTAQLINKINENQGVNFEDIRLTGVTMNQAFDTVSNKYLVTYDSNNKINFEKDKIEYSEYSNMFNYEVKVKPYFYVKNNNGTFVKDGDSYRSATTTELDDDDIEKYSIYLDKSSILYVIKNGEYQEASDDEILDDSIIKYVAVADEKYGTMTYSHQMEAATINKDYISFDLYFKAISTGGEALTNFKLTFGEKTEMKVKEKAGDSLDNYKNVTLVNSFSTYNPLLNYGETYYNQGDTIKMDASNAMRLGVVNNLENKKELSIYEVSNELNYGSTAIKVNDLDYNSSLNPEDLLPNDPRYNIMLNYYNVIHPLYPFDLSNCGADAGQANETIKSYGKMVNSSWKGETLGTFPQDGIIHLTFYVYLEGWDADYIMGITEDAKKINANFEFALERV